MSSSVLPILQSNSSRKPPDNQSISPLPYEASPSLVLPTCSATLITLRRAGGGNRVPQPTIAPARGSVDRVPAAGDDHSEPGEFPELDGDKCVEVFPE